jgi:hypothetical protein
LRLGCLPKQSFGVGNPLLKRGDSRFRQEAFGRVDRSDLFGGFGCFARIAARDARGQQVELQQVASSLDVPRVHLDRRADLFAKPAGQEQLLERSCMLRLDAEDFRCLAVVFSYLPVQNDSLFGKGQRSRVIAERIPDLREEIIPQRLIGALPGARFHESPRPLPVAGLDELFRPGFLGADDRG